MRRSGGRLRFSALLVPLVVVGAAAVVLAAAVQTPGVTAPARPRIDSLRLPAPSAAPPPRVRPGGGAPFPELLIVIAQVLLLVLVAFVAVRLIMLLVRARRGRVRTAAPSPITSSSLGAAAETADAPAVRRGIAAALVALSSTRDPTDAVVRAWLGLQQSAEDAGLRRTAEETPTEFTSRVLARSGVDLAALRALLALYLRARFGGEPVTAGDAEAARVSLQALESSWRTADEEVSR